MVMYPRCTRTLIKVLLAVMFLTPFAMAQSSMTITYFTVAETDRDAGHTANGVSTNYVLPALGANGFPVYNTSATATTGTMFIPQDILADNEITWWSPTLNNGGSGGVSDVVETGTGVALLPYVNNKFFPPNGTGANDVSAFQAAILTGTLYAPIAETISFTISSDDMAFLYLDGQIACDDGGMHSATAVPCTTSVISAGTHTLQLFFVDLHQTGSVLDFTVTTSNTSINPIGVTTTALAVTSGGAPVTTVATGSVVTLTASVTSNHVPVTTGQVNFCDATAVLCDDIHRLGTAQLTSAGTATIKFIPGIGSHSYKAVFAGDRTYIASSSTATPLAVTGLFPTTTTIAQSGIKGNYTLTATVTGFVDSSPLASPTGTVSFFDTNYGNALLATDSVGTGVQGLNWFNSQTPAIGITPFAIAVGDFNGDGIPDLAVLDYNQVGSTGSVTIFLGNGDGTFTQVAASPTTGTYSFFIVAADFNGDGKTDLAVANSGSGGTITVLLGNGDGTFTPASTNLSNLTSALALAVGDFNEDGIPDIAVVDNTVPSVTILLGNGDGTFTPTGISTPTGSGPSGIAVDDFNGDGHADLAVANEGSNTVTILLGKGDGTFTVATASPATGNGPTSIVAGDFNQDGKPDIAVVNIGDDTVTVLLGNGDGTFTPTATNLATGVNPVSIAIGDFNGDGKADMVVANRLSNTVSIFLGNGDGTFTSTATNPSAGRGSSAIATADFNGDGLSDLAVANSTMSTGNLGTAFIFLTQLTQTATATVTAISPIGAGTHLADASYPGDTLYKPSISGTTALAGMIQPTITWATPAAIPYGTPLSGTQLDAVASTAGTYTYTPPAGTILSPGSQPLSVLFTPTDVADYINATATTSITVNKAPVNVALASSATSVPVGTPFTLTATVLSTTTGTPTGTVTFFNGTNAVGTASLVNGVATFSLSLLTYGSNTLTASYSGDADFLAGNSNPVTVTEISAITTTVLTATPNPSPFGFTVTFSATVSSLAGTPTGAVSFYDGAALLGTSTLAAGVATFSTSTLAVGSHNITAVYAGTANFAASTSNLIVEFIGDFSITASPGSGTVYTVQSAAYTIAITPNYGFNLPVTLSCSGLPANTTCAFSPATVSGGSGSSTLTIQTTAPSPVSSNHPQATNYRYAALGCLLLILLPRRLRSIPQSRFLIVFCMLLMGASLTGCTSQGALGHGTPVGSYQITINGVASNGSQTLAHATTVMLKVESLY